MNDAAPTPAWRTWLDAAHARARAVRPLLRAHWRTVAVAAGGVLMLTLLIAWSGTGYVYETYTTGATATVDAGPAGETVSDKSLVRMRARQRQLRRNLVRLAPRGLYIVIDQTNNRLYLRKDQDVVLEAVCSAGSGMVLKESEGGRQWVFDTPRGRFQVITKVENPIWKKPDWAFVEEGEPIPTNPAERFEAGTLGEYAFYFGNGYMIHGTLYERLLGRSVTHGCIRLGRDDLRALWAKVRVGTPIFIF